MGKRTSLFELRYHAHSASTVAHLTPDQEVASSILAVVTHFFGTEFRFQIFRQVFWLRSPSWNLARTKVTKLRFRTYLNEIELQTLNRRVTFRDVLQPFSPSAVCHTTTTSFHPLPPLLLSLLSLLSLLYMHA
jgi:hypothetical protein